MTAALRAGVSRGTLALSFPPLPVVGRDHGQQSAKGWCPMISPRVLTSIVLLCVTLGLVVYDAVVIWRAYPAATISEVILAVAQEQPILPFLVGVLVGHLLWPQIGQPPPVLTPLSRPGVLP